LRPSGSVLTIVSFASFAALATRGNDFLRALRVLRGEAFLFLGGLGGKAFPFLGDVGGSN